MPRPALPAAVVLAALLGLLVAAPASAATTGTVCGQVTAFVPSTGVDGSLTIDGRTEIIDSTATGAIDAGTALTLTTVADADATTCLNITADPTTGEITDIDVAAQARICGAATTNATTGITSIGGVDLPAGLVSAGSSLDAFLDAAASTNANVCADVTIDETSGLLTSVRLDATLTVCGDAALDADSATLGGLDVPFSLLDAEAEAALALAAQTGIDTCITLVVDDTRIVQANVRASIDVCGEVTLDAAGNAVVNVFPIAPALLDADAAALLRLAATADGSACVAIDAASTNGDTTVAAAVVIEVCADVTAIADGTITLLGVPFLFAGAADADVQVGDEVCVTAGTGAGGPVILELGGVLGSGGAAPAARSTGMLPDTAVGHSASLLGLASLLLVAGGIGFSAARRAERVAR